MRGIFALLGTSFGGGIGWWLGGLWDLPAAVLLSAIGTGMGLYWGRRLFDEWLG